ncbi:MAG: hypothetical protein FWH40_00495 [Coriobacteriia bacterium]|nr:hypothetical protein [Coriobacteriia bacterium]
MLNAKENYLARLRGEQPDYVPLYTFGRMPGVTGPVSNAMMGPPLLQPQRGPDGPGRSRNQIEKHDYPRQGKKLQCWLLHEITQALECLKKMKAWVFYKPVKLKKHYSGDEVRQITVCNRDTMVKCTNQASPATCNGRN